MVTAADVLRHLRAAQSDGRLARLCRGHEVQLMTLFGSARVNVEEANDVDIAYLMAEDRDPHTELDFLGELVGVVGDQRVDFVPLRRGNALILFSALAEGEPLWEAEPGLFLRREMAARRAFRDHVQVRRRMERVANGE